MPPGALIALSTVKSVSYKLQKLGYMPAQDGSGLEESWMIINVIWEMGAQ